MTTDFGKCIPIDEKLAGNLLFSLIKPSGILTPGRKVKVDREA